MVMTGGGGHRYAIECIGFKFQGNKLICLTTSMGSFDSEHIEKIIHR